MVATDPRFKDSGYANPDVLVSTDWVAEHLNDGRPLRAFELWETERWEAAAPGVAAP